MKKDMLSLLELNKTDFDHLLSRAAERKQMRLVAGEDRPLKGCTIGLLFEKASTRTRVSFEAAIAQLGGTSLFISVQDTQLARSEPLEDTARVFSGYLDALVVRTFSQKDLEQWARYTTIPVINALSDSFHPTQVLSDLLTVIEHKGGYADQKIVWVGDGNNVAHSWINAAAILGLELILACPQGYFPDAEIVKQAEAVGAKSVQVISDPIAAVRDADVLYTDVWASMGQEAEQKKRLAAFDGYELNQKLLSCAKPDAVVMHCLPAHRGEEISAEVLEGPQSIVWDQAENKMHMAKAILEALICNR